MGFGSTFVLVDLGGFASLDLISSLPKCRSPAGPIGRWHVGSCWPLFMAYCSVCSSAALVARLGWVGVAAPQLLDV